MSNYYPLSAQSPEIGIPKPTEECGARGVRRFIFPGGRPGRDVTDSNSGLSRPYRLVLNTFYAPPCFLSSPASLILLALPLSSQCGRCFRTSVSFFFFFILVSLDFLQICPTETEPEHLQALTLKDVAGPKNVRSKHMRVVFIINQLYGPLMEVISAKFMLGAFFFFFFSSPPSLAKQLRDSKAPPTVTAAPAATSSGLSPALPRLAPPSPQPPRHLGPAPARLNSLV